jgi:rare lipoprotein A
VVASQPKPAPQAEKPTETAQPSQQTTPVLKPQDVSTQAKPEPKPTPTTSEPTELSDIELYELKVTRQKPGGFTVQIGSYKELVNLLRIADDLKTSLKKEVRVQVANINGEKVYRLMVGEFSTRREAESFKVKAAQLYPDCFIVELK